MRWKFWAAINEMFPYSPLRKYTPEEYEVEAFATDQMKDPPDEEEVVVITRSSYFSNDENESYDSEDSLSFDTETNEYN